MIKRLGAFFLDVIEVVVLAVAIFLITYLLILQPHKIKGISMEPNFPNGEYLLTDKVSYRFGEPKRGDIIVFKAPSQPDEEFIKRIIGLPGEKISIKNGRIYINGILLEEKYLASDIYTSAGSFLTENNSVTISANEYFVLGDNRDHSSDSRAWGFVPKKSIVGRAWLVYWPPKSAGVVRRPHYNL